QRGEQHGPARGERPSRPPQVQRGRVPVADRLLLRRGLVDLDQRQGNLDELLAVRSGAVVVQSVRVSVPILTRSASEGGLSSPRLLFGLVWNPARLRGRCRLGE